MDLVNLRKRRQGGMAYIETLLAMPFVMLLLFAMFDFSIALKDFLAANHAAEVGVRSASLSLGNSCTVGAIRTAGGTAAAVAMVQAGVIDPTAQATYASNSVVTQKADGSQALCTAGLLEVQLPMVLELPMVHSMLDPFGVFVGTGDPITYTVRAVALNENDNS